MLISTSNKRILGTALAASAIIFLSGCSLILPQDDDRKQSSEYNSDHDEDEKDTTDEETDEDEDADEDADEDTDEDADEDADDFDDNGGATVSSIDIAILAEDALEDETGDRPTIDCGDFDVDVYEGNMVFCDLFADDGSVYDVEVTITDVDLEDQKYYVSVEVDNEPQDD